MKQGLSLRVSQSLTLTPQLQQSIRLLQLSTLELSQEVGQMLDDNPFLEVADDSAERESFGVEHADTPLSQEVLANENAIDLIAACADEPKASGLNDAPTTSTPSSASDTAAASSTAADSDGESDVSSEASADISWDGDGGVDTAPDDGEWGGEAPARTNNVQGDDVEASDLTPGHVSLQDFLHLQTAGLRLSQEDRAALYFLIESLDDDGYLSDPIADLAHGLVHGQGKPPHPNDDASGALLAEVEALVQAFGMALQLLQHMEPVGVGARHLAECLSLQVRAQQQAADREGLSADAPLRETLRVAQAICQQPMALLARRDVKRLAYVCACTEAQVKLAIGLIARLDPKPGRRFVNVERNAVLPDVIVRAKGRQLTVTLNPDVMPRLRVHEVYANALRQHKGSSGPALQQRLQEARWFIKNIQQRFDTILRVSTAIVERQKGFFTHGALAMRPLVLREIADELGLHESTISRVTTAKYMSTPFGTFELKYFFGSGLGTETGGSASSTAVRVLIGQFIAAENLAKPLSDSQISALLKDQGIECARRTVAKYREALRLAPANLRKTL